MSAEAPGTGKKNRWRILLVDDKDGGLSAICELIESAGYRVLGSTDAERFLHEEHSADPDLLCRDLKKSRTRRPS